MKRMAPREQVKSDVFESRVSEKDLEWFRRWFHIPADYTLSVTNKKAHEPYTGFEKLVVYMDQMDGGLRFPLDPFVKSFLNRYNIAPGQLHPNSYRILTGFLELMHKEGVDPTLDMLRYVYSLTKKKGELAFSFSAFPSLNIFSRLKDLKKSWRHMYFVVEHKSDFSDIRRLWVDECQKIRRPQLPSVHEALMNKLHEEFLAKRTSAYNCSSRYIQRVYPWSRVSNGESCPSKGIF